jgi:LEA14-like dessication related protein
MSNTLHKGLKTVSLFLILATTLTSCFNYEEVEITDIKSVKLLEFSDKGLVVESEIQITNPNNFTLSVVDSDFDVYIKNKRIGKAYIDSKVKISKNSSDYHIVVLKSDYEDLASGAMTNLIALTMGSDKINFKVEGFIVGKAFLFKKKVKVSHEGIVPLKLY